MSRYGVLQSTILKESCALIGILNSPTPLPRYDCASWTG